MKEQNGNVCTSGMNNVWIRAASAQFKFNVKISEGIKSCIFVDSKEKYQRKKRTENKT